MGVAWVKMGGEELVEESVGMRASGEWSIVKGEMAGICMALSDMRRKRVNTIIVFSDCAVALSMIENMESEGVGEGVWESMVDQLNEWEVVELVWIPGHRGIPGNAEADRKVKEARNWKLNNNGRL